jgi:DNA ligase-1
LKRFLELWTGLDETTKTSEKVRHLAAYFRDADPADSVWALSLLTGRRPRVPIKRSLLQLWARESAGIEQWLFDECYAAVGDLSETMALVLPAPENPEDDHPLAWWMEWIASLANQMEIEQKDSILWAWNNLDQRGRFILHKLIGGSFRVGVSQELVVRGLSQASGVPAAVLAHRLMGTWIPSAEFFEALVGPADARVSLTSQPYPFCLAHGLETDPEQLGPAGDWLIEWKWDGIRAQLIRRGKETFLWSRGEDMIHLSFPEIVELGDNLPDGTVLDGEILAWSGDRPAPFAQLQRRLGRKVVGKKLLAEVPCVLVAFDLLEYSGEDWRPKPLRSRRAQLESIPGVRVSERLAESDWNQVAESRQQARERQAEGLMLKRLDSEYTGGRKKGVWWKWKLSPFSVDAVLIYAQRGTGKRASLYTDYTFGVWSDGVLVPFAKAYSGLSDDEIQQVDRFIRNNIKEKFGPVRTVEPKLVFEIAFEGIQLSSRHKSGVAVRFPRIARWRTDKRPEDADSIGSIKALLEARG